MTVIDALEMLKQRAFDAEDELFRVRATGDRVAESRARAACELAFGRWERWKRELCVASAPGDSRAA